MQDGNIHLHVGNVAAKASDRRHRSVISAASYQSGEVLYSDKKQQNIDTREADDGDVLFTEIIAPAGAGVWATDRQSLWNRVETTAKRKDARLGKKIELAFTRDIPPKLRLAQLRDFVDLFVSWGCVADVAIHGDASDHNPHAHILLTTYHLNGDGFGKKITELDERRFVKDCRKRWSDLTNTYLKKVGSTLRVDHRSYKKRNIDKRPGQHRGTREVTPHSRAALAGRELAGEPTPALQNKGEALMPPTFKDRQDYPHLTARDDWPPAREPAPDLSPQERGEHTRYWHEQDKQEIEHIDRQDHDAYHERLAEPLKPQGEYAFAIAKAREEAGMEPPQQQQFAGADEYREQFENEIARRQYAQEEYNKLHTRAENMHRGLLGLSREEIHWREVARNSSPETKEMIHKWLMHNRMKLIQERDRAKWHKEVERTMRDNAKEEQKRVWAELMAVDKERARQAALQDHDERHEIVQGPNDEPIHTSERDRAEDAMLEELERELGKLPEPDLGTRLQNAEAVERMRQDYEEADYEPYDPARERERER